MHNVLRTQAALKEYFLGMPLVAGPEDTQALSEQNSFIGEKLLGLIDKINSAQDLEEHIAGEAFSRLFQLSKMLVRGRGNMPPFEQVLERVRKLLAAEKQMRYLNFSLSSENQLLKQLVELRGKSDSEQARQTQKWAALLKEAVPIADSLNVYIQKHAKKLKNHDELVKLVKRQAKIMQTREFVDRGVAEQVKYEQLRSALEAERRTRLADLEDHTNKLRSLQNQTKVTQERLSSLQTQRKELKVLCESLAAQNSNLKAEVRMWESKSHQLSAELQNNKKQLGQLSQAIKSIETQAGDSDTTEQNGQLRELAQLNSELLKLQQNQLLQRDQQIVVLRQKVLLLQSLLCIYEEDGQQTNENTLI